MEAIEKYDFSGGGNRYLQLKECDIGENGRQEF